MSLFTPTEFVQLPEIRGIRVASSHSGVKKNKLDTLVCDFMNGADVAGVFTRSACVSHTVNWNRSIIENELIKCLIVVSGNANTYNGKSGSDAVEILTGKCSEMFSCERHEVYFCATGLIGEPFPTEKIVHGFDNLDFNSTWHNAAESIRTTDTYPKLHTISTKISGVDVRINGICKGSGMIAPNMATMLGFIFTDANISSHVLQEILSKYTEETFNSITVDSDCSTNDTVLLCATGKAEHDRIENVDAQELEDFKYAILCLMKDMALSIVKDGEGITKLIEIKVSGAKSVSSARKIGMSIANSPLVKTAIGGADPNFCGRALAAIGKSQEEISEVSINVGQFSMMKRDCMSLSDNKNEIYQYMNENDEISISVDVGYGDASATVWTCDLSEQYVQINQDYLNST